MDTKIEFYKKYEAFKNEELDVSQLTGSELIKINALLDEEVMMNKRRLDEALESFYKNNI